MQDLDQDDDSTSTPPSTGNTSNTSRRDRFKGALARTKSKFKKQQGNEKSGSEEHGNHDLDEDVEDFLSAGRTSTSSRNTTGRDTGLGEHRFMAGAGAGAEEGAAAPGLSSPERTPFLDQQPSSRPSTSESFPPHKQSPRRIVVPRIDVSNSQRWPGAQPVGKPAQEQQRQEKDGQQEGAAFLRPEYQARSQSATSLSKRKGRGRGLSVTFIEAPPVIIGEGGDDAPKPPVEISKARARARSVSPKSSRAQLRGAPRITTTQTTPPSPPTGHSLSGQRAAVPGLRHEPPDVLKPRGMQRVVQPQTDTPPSSAVTASPASSLDREFEMTLRLGSGSGSRAVGAPELSSHGEDGSVSARNTAPVILAPRPVRPVHPPPAVLEIPEPGVDEEMPAARPIAMDQREGFREGDALRMHRDDETINDDEFSPRGTRNRW